MEKSAEYYKSLETIVNSAIDYSEKVSEELKVLSSNEKVKDYYSLDPVEFGKKYGFGALFIFNEVIRYEHLKEINDNLTNILCGLNIKEA